MIGVGCGVLLPAACSARSSTEIFSRSGQTSFTVAVTFAAAAWKQQRSSSQAEPGRRQSRSASAGGRQEA